MRESARFGVRRLFRLVTRRQRVAEVVDLEISHHLESRFDQLIEDGWSPTEARREAGRLFGQVQQIRAECEQIRRDVKRKVQRMEIVDSVAQDLRYAGRGLRKNPGFAAAVILTLGLGIGANTAIFTMVDALLIRPLPYDRPDELVEIWASDSTKTTGRPTWVTGQARTWRREHTSIGETALYGIVSVVQTDEAEATLPRVKAVSPNLFSLLGVMPQVGRPFLPEDAVPGASPVAILNDTMWRAKFGGDPSILGRTIELDGLDYTVVGVMPPNFRFPTIGGANLWLPLSLDNTAGGSALRGLNVIARLMPGVSLEVAQERTDALTKFLAATDPQPRGWHTLLQPHDHNRANDEVTQALWLLAGTVVLMLIISLVNGINLLSVRATARRREIMTRVAIGASRPRLLRQLITESLVLALMGGAVALMLAKGALVAIIGILPSEVTVFAANEIVISSRVVWYAALVSVGTGFVFGIIPALTMIRRPMTVTGSEIGRHSTSGGKMRLHRGGLVVGEIAVSMVLLVGAGLLINSFVRLVRVDSGFNPDHLINVTLQLSSKSYPDGPIRYEFFARLKDAVAAIPGVQSVTMASGLPPRGGGSLMFGVALQAEGQPAAESGQPLIQSTASVDTNFFRVLEVPLIAGASFATVPGGRTDVAIIDHDLARFLWRNESPIGHRFRISDTGPWYTVVGLVEDVKLMGQDDRRGEFDIFFPLPERTSGSVRSLAVRTTVDPTLVLPAIRNVIRKLDSSQPIWRLETTHAAIADSVQKPRFLLILMVIFAVVGLTLAAVGLYGVLAFTVIQRSRELGIRMALGAQTTNVRRMVLRDGLILAVVGVGVGLAGSIAASRVIQNLLFNVEPTDPLTLAAVSVVMIGTALAACYFPARRATRVDPMSVLRVDT